MNSEHFKRFEINDNFNFKDIMSNTLSTLPPIENKIISKINNRNKNIKNFFISEKLNNSSKFSDIFVNNFK